MKPCEIKSNAKKLLQDRYSLIIASNNKIIWENALKDMLDKIKFNETRGDDNVFVWSEAHYILEQKFLIKFKK